MSAGALIALLLIGAFAVLDWRLHRRRDAELAQVWMAAGPPCPVLTASAYAAAGYPRREQVVDFDGVLIARQAGHLSCKELRDPSPMSFIEHPVCLFTSPVALHVRAGGAEGWFQPGFGRGATLQVKRGQIGCTLGSRFTPFDDPT